MAKIRLFSPLFNNFYFRHFFVERGYKLTFEGLDKEHPEYIEIHNIEGIDLPDAYEVCSQFRIKYPDPTTTKGVVEMRFRDRADEPQQEFDLRKLLFKKSILEQAIFNQHQLGEVDPSELVRKTWVIRRINISDEVAGLGFQWICTQSFDDFDQAVSFASQLTTYNGKLLSLPISKTVWEDSLLFK